MRSGISRVTSNHQSQFLILVLFVFILKVESKVFTNCEFGKVLIANGIDNSELGNWICLANSVSGLNSSKLTNHSTNNNLEYGIFGVSNYYNCWDVYKQVNNECGVNCTDLLDDNLEDDIKCAQRLKRNSGGFSKTWGYLYRNCENRSLDSYTKDCDFINGRPPVIRTVVKNYTFEINATDEHISCETEGTLPIQLKWFKYGLEVRPSQYPTEFEEDKENNLTTLTIKFPLVQADTAGAYTCQGKSAYGQVETIFYVRVSPDGEDDTSTSEAYATSTLIMIAISVIGTILLMTIAFYTYFRHYLGQSAKQGLLSKQQIIAFYEGLPENKGFELDETQSKIKEESNSTILAKIYSKPYRKFELEIPEGDLEIDEETVLGSGQFGIVYKGEYHKETPVAVKTIKVQAKPEETIKQLEALMDELKVMSYIGSHPNIVLLLGAQTTKLKENKLFLVLEYCHLGSLKSYLKGQRSKEILECPDDSNSIESGFESATSDYVPPPDMDRVYIKDFISYAYQIAYGMNYLTQKRIIHSDIAIRNILLMDRNIVKITDFGLSKRMSDYQEYVRNNQEFVPWRWWSIESLRDFTFTSKSDVWSYGVALWEIFTLAQVPHPEQTWNPEFSKKLENGLRLLKPPLASDQMYEIMSQCWAVKPEERPTFQILCDQLRQILRKMSKNEADYGDSQGSATKHSPHYVTTEPIDA